MKRIDALLRRAKHIGGDWKPHEFNITRTESGLYRVLCTLWNGVSGSLQPGKSNVNPHREAFFASEEAAYQGIEKYLQEWEAEHAIKIKQSPNIHDCCWPSTDAERKALWKQRGQTVMEKLAEDAGMTLEQYIRKEYPGEIEKWQDEIRWRKEDGIDVEKSVETVDTTGGSTRSD